MKSSNVMPIRKNAKGTDKVGAVLIAGGGIVGMQAALDLADAGFYVHLVEKSPAIGGVMAGPSRGLETDLIDVLIYGPLAIILMNISRIINDRLILSRFRIRFPLFIILERLISCLTHIFTCRHFLTISYIP